MSDKSNFHPWIPVADKILKPLEGIDTFYTNMQLLIEFQSVFKIIPEFYKDLIGIWQLMSKGECHNIEFMLSQNLWNNKFITRNSHSIVYADLLSEGIKTVLDLYNPVGLIESWQSISQEFGLENPNFISWYSTVQCIPREWKELIRHTGNLPADHFSDFRHGVFISGFFTKLSQVKANQIYDSPFQKCFIPATAKKTLSGKFGIGEELWPKIYMLSSKFAIDTRTKVFQYKILNNVLYLNKHLYKMKVVESPLCSLCQKENETFEHLFVDCTLSKKLWTDIKQSLSPHLALPNLYVKNCIFGFIDNYSFSVVENHILLLYKRHIYDCRLNKRLTNFLGFKNLINIIRQIEEKISRKRNTMAKHFQKWESISVM